MLIGMDPAQVLAAQQKVKEEPASLEVPKDEQKKGKQKSKDNSHSLLHVSFFYLKIHTGFGIKLFFFYCL